MTSEIPLDNETLTHLLGYLSEKEWKDALKDENCDDSLIEDLMKIQDDKYGLNLTRLVD